MQDWNLSELGIGGPVKAKPKPVEKPNQEKSKPVEKPKQEKSKPAAEKVSFEKIFNKYKMAKELDEIINSTTGSGRLKIPSDIVKEIAKPEGMNQFRAICEKYLSKKGYVAKEFGSPKSNTYTETNELKSLYVQIGKKGAEKTGAKLVEKPAPAKELTEEEKLEELWANLPNVARDNKTVQNDVIAFLKNQKKEEYNLVVYGAANAEEYTRMVNHINTKMKLGSQEVAYSGIFASYIPSESEPNKMITTYTITIKKIFLEKDAAARIEALKRAYSECYNNPERADFYNDFVAKYGFINKNAASYSKLISKDELENMYMSALGGRNGYLLAETYDNLIMDPLNTVFRESFDRAYKTSTTSPTGPIKNVTYEAEFSSYLKKRLNMTLVEMQSDYNNIVMMESLIDNLDKVARTNPNPDEKEAYVVFDNAVNDLKKTNAERLYKSIMEQKYGTSNLIEEYETRFKDEEFREWRKGYRESEEFPIELTQLELRAQYNLYKYTIPALKKYSNYDQKNMDMVLKAVKAVDPVGHVDFLQHTLPVFVRYFPNEYDAVSVLAAAYQESFRHGTSIPYLRVENDRIRMYYQRAGKDVEKFISADVQRLINDFKARSEEEQMEIITQLEKTGRYVASLPSLGLKDIKNAYRYNDMIVATPSFEEVARLIRVSDAVRRAYPPGFVFDYLPVFSAVDILGRTAAELSQITIEKSKPMFTTGNLDFKYGQTWDETGKTSETAELIGAAAGKNTRMDGRLKMVGSALDSGAFNAYYWPIFTASQINGLNLDFQREDHINLYLNAGVPAKVNFITATFYNKASNTWESKNYRRKLSADGTSSWIHVFTRKLSAEEAQMDYARYGDNTRDVRVRMDDKTLTGFVYGTTIRSSVAMAAVLDGKFGDEQSKALGVAYKPSKGTIKVEDAKIYLKAYDVIDADKKRSKELAGSLIGTNLEITADKEVEGTGREAYVAKWLNGKGYYETAYYNFVNEQGGSVYLRYGELGKLMNAWVIAKCISNEQGVDPGIVGSVDLKDSKGKMSTVQLSAKPELTTAKFMGNKVVMEGASADKLKLFNAILNIKRGTGAGLEVREEESQKTIGLGATFTLKSTIAAVRETCFFDPLNLSGIGWFIGANFYQHEPISYIALTTGEAFKDNIAKEDVFRANLAGFWRNWYDKQAFLVVDWKKNTSYVTNQDSLSKTGIKAGLTYYDIRPIGTYAWTVSLSEEKDSINQEELRSLSIIGSKATTSDALSVEFKYKEKMGAEKTGSVDIRLMYRW